MTTVIPNLNFVEPKIPTQNKRSKKPLIFVSVFLIIVTAIAIPVYLNRQKLIAFIYPKTLKSLRNIGLIHTNIPDYFLALETQNPLYDYNDDGAVTGEDYGALLAAASATQNTTTTATSTSGSGTATSETITYPSIKAYGSDAFNGVATAGISINLPPGRAGLTPSLSLSYSSAVVDDMLTGIETKYRNDPTHSYQKQAGVAGLGWSLSGINTISRDNKGTFNDSSDDTFIISFPGGSANLTLESGDDNYAVFRTAPDIKIKVERWGLKRTHTVQFAQSHDVIIDIWRYHWIATTGDGSKYTFGTSPIDNWHRSYDQETLFWGQGTGNSWYPLYESDSLTNKNPYVGFVYYTPTKDVYHTYQNTWYLTQAQSVQEMNGQKVSMKYNYDLEIGQKDSNYYSKTIYLNSMDYSDHQVSLTYENRLDKDTHQDDNSNPGQSYNSSKRLKQVTIKTKDKNGTFKVRGAYTLNYIYGFDTQRLPDNNNDSIPDQVEGGHALHSLLTQVTQWNNDPAVSGAEKMPPQTFSYGANCGTFRGGCPLTSFTQDSTVNNLQERTANDFFLMSSDNGYGGKVTYEYYAAKSDGTDNALVVTYCDEDKVDGGGVTGCKEDHAYNTQRHRLAATIIHDGLGNQQKTAYNFTGTGATKGLAYVKKYGYFLESMTGTNCCSIQQCNGGSNIQIGCRCPGDSTTCGNSFGGQWNCCLGTYYPAQIACTQWAPNCTMTNANCCPSGYKGQVRSCIDPNNNQKYVCSSQSPPTCYSDCQSQVIDDAFSGYEFLGYPEVETIAYHQNSNAVAARSKAYYYQAIQTDTCFKTSPLKGVAYQTLQYDVHDPGSYSENLSTNLVRFGNMFDNYKNDKSPSQLDAFCPDYHPETAVSTVLTTDTVSKTYLSNQPVLCTRSSTSYNQLNGAIDNYALPHKQFSWGKVSCSDPNIDDTSDAPKVSYTDYTAADTVRWLLPKPKESWASDNLSNVKYNYSRTYYDDQALGILGKYGNVTKTETILDTATSYTSTITYDPNYTWLAIRTTDPNNQSTTSEYDSTYHMFPVKMTNPAGHTSSTEYDFNTTDSTHPNSGGVLGLPVKTTDPNGAINTIVYDKWGRSIESYAPGRKPGTSRPNSFTKYYYYNETEVPANSCTDNSYCLFNLGKEISNQYGPQFAVQKGSLVNDTGSGSYSLSWTLADGTGSTIQSRQSFVDTDNSRGIQLEPEGLRDLLSSSKTNTIPCPYNQAFTCGTSYNSMTYSASPHSGQTSPYDTRDILSDSSIRKTQSIVDGSGRSIQSINSDGTIIKTVYNVGGNPLKTKTLDAHCNDSDSNTPCTESISESNAYGQSLRASVYSQKDNKTLTTSSQYHTVLGSVLSVTDPLGTIVNETTYDNLGRKVTLWDIDMSPIQ